MPVTPEQAWAIGHLCHALRDEWSAEAVVENVRKVANRRAGDVALASIRAALDSGARYPAVIPTAGSHWAEGVTYDAPSHPRRQDDCPMHPGNWADACHACATEGRAADDDEPQTPVPGAPGPALAKALARQGRASTCSHGVRRTHCTDCEETPA